MPLTVCFVRHGESQANVDRVFANRVEYPAHLTPAGRAQAKALTRTLRAFPVTHVYASPLIRARQTAAFIASASGVPWTTAEALREYDVGDFEGQPHAGEDAWRWRRYEEVERSWGEGNHRVSLPGGESLAGMEARFLPFMETLAGRHMATDTLVLVGHGGLYRAMLPRLFPAISPEFASAHHLGHCDLVIAEHDPAGWRCVQWANERFPCG